MAFMVRRLPVESGSKNNGLMKIRTLFHIYLDKDLRNDKKKYLEARIALAQMMKSRDVGVIRA